MAFDGPIQEDLVGGVIQIRVGGIHAKQVSGDFLACEGVDIGPELHPVELEEINQVVFREILGAVEHHVLEEMGEAQLCLCLLQGAHADHELHLDAFGRLFMMLDVKGQPIFQDAIAHVRREGEGAPPNPAHPAPGRRC